MKKTRLLSVVLTLALVFTTVFAGAGSVYAGSIDEPVAGKVQMQLKAKKSLYPETEEATISAKAMYNSSTAKPSYSTYTIPAGGYIRVVPIEAPASGWMYLDAKAALSNDGYVDVYLVDKYEYDSNTHMISLPDDAIGDVNYLYEGEDLPSACMMPVSKGKCYYALIMSDEYSEVDASISIRARILTTGQRSISESSSKWTTFSGINKSDETASTYLKFKAERSGVLKVSVKEYGYSSSYATVRLYNSEKKLRSEKVAYYSDNGTAKFGVKKGSTYYIRITDAYGSYEDDYKVGVRYTITSATDRSIGSKSKAKQIYRKDDSTKSLFVAANSNSVDYYKFKVTTARKTKITVKNDNMSSGYITMRLYKSNGSFIKKVEVPAGYEGYISTTSNLPKGTYYVKITKSLKASGRYSIRWTY